MTTSGTPEEVSSTDAGLQPAVLDSPKVAFFDPAHAQAPTAGARFTQQHRLLQVPAEWDAP
ncbi:hypothetical protein [Streptomyces californicus]|uniref:hypothetical protein n=1 Tax=Streptomyces californicus TaxID=67351 RepID=UPI0037149726